MHQYHLMLDGYPQGPFSLSQAQEKIGGRKDVLVWREGFADWLASSQVGELEATTSPSPASASSSPASASSSPSPALVSPPPAPTRSAPRVCDEVDFVLYGSEMQFVEIELDPEESVIAEAGSMMYKEATIEMRTIFGDGSDNGSQGVIGKLFGAGKRVLTGESLFITNPHRKAPSLQGGI